MGAFIWMPLYVGDYRSNTAHLNAAQHGAYLLLIMHYWLRGGLPDDDGQLARIACMTPAEWRKNRATIRAFFGDGWRHGRVDEEIAKAVERYDRRSNAGKQGNAKRWGSHRNAIAMGSQSQSQSQSPKNPSQGEEDLEGYSTNPGLSTARPTLAVVNGQGGGR
ncbi:YdaU family protein [Bradyrhizobium sp. Arg314]